MRVSRSIALAAAVAVTACASRPLPDFGALYGKSARHHGADRNPVIVIPGIIGSRLKDGATGRTVWGAFAGDYANPSKPDGARLFALPMAEGVPLAGLNDRVTPDGVLDRLKVKLLLPFQLKAYFHILATLGAGGYRDEGLSLAGAVDYGKDHFTCFQFAYDWRRDNVENAARLDAFIREKGAYVREENRKRYGVDRAVKFDLVAHSMGGLIARYYLLYGGARLPEDGSVPRPTWAGLSRVGRVILVGTPNAGSVDSVFQLVKGRKFAPFLPRYTPALLGTFPSVYQLLPRTRHGAVLETGAEGAARVDVLDPAVWEASGWGLADPREDRVLSWLLPGAKDAAERRRIALDHQRKCLARAKQLFAALDAAPPPEPRSAIDLLAGDAAPTASVAARRGPSGGLEVIRREAGDGTVLRSSALLDERIGAEWQPSLVSPIPWRGVTFLFTDHLGMTKDPAFTDNVLYMLLEERRR